MSIPKEKLIIQEIKRIVNRPHADHTGGQSGIFLFSDSHNEIIKIINSYVDPGYIGGPVVGEPEGDNKNK